MDNDPGETAKLIDIKRQETLVALIQNGDRYCGFAAAAVLTLAELIGGVDRLTAIAGASFLLILVGFAVQRILTDIIAGFAMFAERWYAVGDTVAVSGLEVQGSGRGCLSAAHEAAHARRRGHPYPQLTDPCGEGAAARGEGAGGGALRLRPRARGAAHHLGCGDAARRARRRSSGGRGSRVSDRVLQEFGVLSVAVPRATTAPGREWLVDSFFSDLLKERAEEGLIVHGPVVLSVERERSRSFARASAAMRWQERRAALPTQ